MNMKWPVTVLTLTVTLCQAAEFRITSLSADGILSVTNTFTNGICTIEKSEAPAGPWRSAQNLFTTSQTAHASLTITSSFCFMRALAVDLSNGREGFTNLIQSYGLLSTIAGAGGTGADGVNKWNPEFEGGPATNALLSRPHIAMTDRRGNLFIADKDAHAVRLVTPAGIIHTFAGINEPGNGPDEPTDAREVALWEPNGLWVRSDGTVYILDLQNGKVRRVDTNNVCETLFTVPGGITAGRGLWVSEDESLAYVASGTAVKRWTPDDGVVDFAIGFVELGNLVVDPWGKLVITDRFGSRVYRIDDDQTSTVIAGADVQGPDGGDGGLATATVLAQVRGVWFLPNRGYLLCTHQSSQVWYVDPNGYIHLLLAGYPNAQPAGDGTWFYNLSEARVSECRAVAMDYQGNIIITDNDSGYIRKIEFLRLNQ
jgi:sugar lactone lactonase YvrE